VKPVTLAVLVWVWLNSLRYNTKQGQQEDKRKGIRPEAWKENQSEGLREYWRQKKAKKGGR
jgi:hypothetical protein